MATLTNADAKVSWMEQKRVEHVEALLAAEMQTLTDYVIRSTREHNRRTVGQALVEVTATQLYAVLGYTGPCYALLCYAVLCYAGLGCAVLYAMLR